MTLNVGQYPPGSRLGQAMLFHHKHDRFTQDGRMYFRRKNMDQVDPHFPSHKVEAWATREPLGERYVYVDIHHAAHLFSVYGRVGEEPIAEIHMVLGTNPYCGNHIIKEIWWRSLEYKDSEGNAITEFHGPFFSKDAVVEKIREQTLYNAFIEWPRGYKEQ